MISPIIVAIVKSYDARREVDARRSGLHFDFDQLIAAVRKAGSAFAVNRPRLEERAAVSTSVGLCSFSHSPTVNHQTGEG